MIWIEAGHRHFLGELKSVVGDVRFRRPAVAAEEKSMAVAADGGFTEPRNAGRYGRRRREFVLKVERR